MSVAMPFLIDSANLLSVSSSNVFLSIDNSFVNTIDSNLIVRFEAVHRHSLTIASSIVAFLFH